MELFEVVLPTIYASALINNDFTGDYTNNELNDINHIVQTYGTPIAIESDSYIILYQGLFTECSVYTFEEKQKVSS